MFEEKKVIHTKRLFMRKPLIEDVEQFYSILKEEVVGKWLLNQVECQRKKQKTMLYN